MRVMLGRLAQAVAPTDEAGSRPDDDQGSPRTPGEARGPLFSQLVYFTVVGTVFTLAYVGLYAMLRTVCGPQLANGISLVMTTVADTAANRRFTFGVRGMRHALLHQAQGLVLFLLGLGATSGALEWLHARAPDATSLTEIAVLAVANLVVGLVRFTAFRVWVFAPPAARPRFLQG